MIRARLHLTIHSEGIGAVSHSIYISLNYNLYFNDKIVWVGGLRCRKIIVC